MPVICLQKLISPITMQALQSASSVIEQLQMRANCRMKSNRLELRSATSRSARQN